MCHTKKYANVAKKIRGEGGKLSVFSKIHTLFAPCLLAIHCNRDTALSETAGLYAPQGVDLGGGGSPQQGMT